MTPRDAGLVFWKDESVWFSSSSVQSRKARNLRADPRCVVTPDDPIRPVVVESVAEVLRDLTAIEEMVSRVNEALPSAPRAGSPKVAVVEGRNLLVGGWWGWNGVLDPPPSRPSHQPSPPPGSACPGRSPIDG